MRILDSSLKFNFSEPKQRVLRGYSAEVEQHLGSARVSNWLSVCHRGYCNQVKVVHAAGLDVSAHAMKAHKYCLTVKTRLIRYRLYIKLDSRDSFLNKF